MTVEVNADGLTQRFGTSQADEALVGVTDARGSLMQVEALIEVGNGVPLVADGNQMLGKAPQAQIALPAGALLRSATLIVLTAFAGATATLDIGTMNNAGTAVDEDGIDAAIAVTAIDAIGDEIACDGALIGTILASDQYISLDVDTADFTAGKAVLIVELVMPR